MMKLLVAAFVALLMAGCQTAKVPRIDLDDNQICNQIIAEAIDWKKLQRRSEEGYDRVRPVKSSSVRTGLYYAPNKQPYSGWVKLMDGDLQLVGLTHMRAGKEDGPFTNWYEKGKKASEGSYKDGKPVTFVVWKPNGEKCPVTNLKDGNGVVVFYNDDGTEGARWTYKDGEMVFN